MAKIAFLGNFRVDYTSETHHLKTLESLGHTVIPLQETEVSSDEVLKIAKDCDLFIWIHTHGWSTPGRVPMDRILDILNNKYNVITMTYHLDLWFGLRRQRDLNRFPAYKKLGHFFTVDKKMADWFNNRTTVKGHYIPAGVFDKECTYKQVKPKNDIIFVGSKTYHPEWEYRSQLIEWLENSYKKFKHYGSGGLPSVRGKELNRLYASTKIVVGDSLCINFDYPFYWSDRVYETLGRGGFLIHPYIKGMEEEFEDKKHLVFYEYGNFEQLKELIDYYLENEEEREKIRNAGHELVKNNYTYRHRWEFILGELGL